MHVCLIVNHDGFLGSHRAWLVPRLLRHGAKVTILTAITRSERREELTALGADVYHVPFDAGGTNPVADSLSFAHIARRLAAAQPDVVHNVTAKPILYGTAATRATTRAGVVNAVTGLGAIFIERERTSLRRRALRTSLRAAYRRAIDQGEVIFQNPDDAQLLGISPRRPGVHLVAGAGVDLGLFQPPEKRGTVPRRVVLPARLLWDKGVGEFVVAAQRLKSEWPDVEFILAGGIDTTNPARIPEPQVNAWAESGAIRWLGHLTKATVARLYAEADIVALPSYREGLPLALAEAAATGAALVTTDVPGCREVVSDGETGWLVPPRDPDGLTRALDHALRDREQRRLRGQAALTRAREHMSQDAVWEGTLRAYERALNTSAARPPGRKPPEELRPAEL